MKSNDLEEWLNSHHTGKQEHLRLPVESLSTWGISPTGLSDQTCSPLLVPNLMAYSNLLNLDDREKERGSRTKVEDGNFVKLFKF